MNRAEIEAKLNRDRAWLLDAFTALSHDELTRGATASEHDPSTMWSALDHLTHLSGIERNFNRMIRRYFEGDANPAGLLRGGDGTPRTREEIMAAVHQMNEDWVARHRGTSLLNVVALGQEARGETLALLGRLSDAQIAEKLLGAPWSDGTVGGVIATNADHGRMHWKWLTDGFAERSGGQA